MSPQNLCILQNGNSHLVHEGFKVRPDWLKQVGPLSHRLWFRAAVSDHLFSGGNAVCVADHRECHLPQESGGATQVLSRPPARYHTAVLLLHTDTQ